MIYPRAFLEGRLTEDQMGIGPPQAVYQARFLQYLDHRGLQHEAAREGLDNPTFIIICNLQRLDGPVRAIG